MAERDGFTWLNAAGSVASLIALGYLWHLFGKDTDGKTVTIAGLPKRGRIPLATVKRAMSRLPARVRACGFTAEQLREGMELEREHRDVTRGGVLATAKIAAAHLCEFKGGRYYPELKQLERKLKRGG